MENEGYPQMAQMTQMNAGASAECAHDTDGKRRLSADGADDTDECSRKRRGLDGMRIHHRFGPYAEEIHEPGMNGPLPSVYRFPTTAG